MARTQDARSSQLYVSSLRQYVREPLVEAVSLLDRELDELAAERAAFESFAAGVADLGTRSPASADDPPAIASTTARSGAGFERVADCYRETVLAVDHYDRVYAEPLIEHVACELGPDLAAALSGDARTAFTPPVAVQFVSRAEAAAATRETLRRHVGREREDVAAHRKALAAVLDELDGSRVPEWYRDQFGDRIERVASERQSTLRNRAWPASNESPRSYCYATLPWDHPVLVAVGRLREAVTV